MPPERRQGEGTPGAAAVVFLQLPRNVYLNEGKIQLTHPRTDVQYLPSISEHDLIQNTFWQSYRKLYIISKAVFDFLHFSVGDIS